MVHFLARTLGPYLGHSGYVGKRIDDTRNAVLDRKRHQQTELGPP